MPARCVLKYFVSEGGAYTTKAAASLLPRIPVAGDWVWIDHVRHRVASVVLFPLTRPDATHGADAEVQCERPEA